VFFDAARLGNEQCPELTASRGIGFARPGTPRREEVGSLLAVARRPRAHLSGETPRRRLLAASPRNRDVGPGRAPHPSLIATWVHLHPIARGQKSVAWNSKPRPALRGNGLWLASHQARAYGLPRRTKGGTWLASWSASGNAALDDARAGTNAGSARRRRGLLHKATNAPRTVTTLGGRREQESETEPTSPPWEAAARAEPLPAWSTTCRPSRSRPGSGFGFGRLPHTHCPTAARDEE
jgi:hypothetical protein